MATKAFPTLKAAREQMAAADVIVYEDGRIVVHDGSTEQQFGRWERRGSEIVVQVDDDQAWMLQR
jgi:hypothetical protein